MRSVTVTFFKMPFLLEYQGFQRVVVGNKVTGNEKRPERGMANRAKTCRMSGNFTKRELAPRAA